MSKFKNALKKAKQDRESGFQQILSTTDERPQQAAQQTETTATAPVNKNGSSKQPLGLEVSYSQTQVQKIDPKLMRQGKIFSLFHDYDVTDQIKTMRTQIIDRLKKAGGNCLLVTSANPYEGKTFVTINLGVSIAHELNKTVLLIDADLRKPTKKHKDFTKDFFHTSIEKGLTDYLLDGHDLPDLLINPGIDKLVLLPAGRTLPNSSEILGSPKMQNLISETKSRYAHDRIVIIDTSSVLTSPDPLVLSKYADGILFVVEKNRTTTEQLKNAIELLQDKPIMGTVVNKVK